MENKPYAVLSPDNKAINFVLWDGISDYNYGQADGNTIVLIPEGIRYGFGWEWNGSEFIDPAITTEGAPV